MLQVHYFAPQRSPSFLCSCRLSKSYKAICCLHIVQALTVTVCMPYVSLADVLLLLQLHLLLLLNEWWKPTAERIAATYRTGVIYRLEKLVFVWLVYFKYWTTFPKLFHWVKCPLCLPEFRTCLANLSAFYCTLSLYDCHAINT